MNSKHEAIKAAYGEFWERLSPFQQEYALAENGTVQIGYTEEQKKLFLDIRKSGLFNIKPIIPKSLSGIETNNGWTRIESEEDLPKYNSPGDFYVLSNEGNKVLLNGANAVRNAFTLKTITHWKLIDTELPIF